MFTIVFKKVRYNSLFFASRGEVRASNVSQVKLCALTVMRPMAFACEPSTACCFSQSVNSCYLVRSHASSFVCSLSW